jgi:hypothetical protein
LYFPLSVFEAALHFLPDKADWQKTRSFSEENAMRRDLFWSVIVAVLALFGAAAHASSIDKPVASKNVFFSFSPLPESELSGTFNTDTCELSFLGRTLPPDEEVGCDQKESDRACTDTLATFYIKRRLGNCLVRKVKVKEVPEGWSFSATLQCGGEDEKIVTVPGLPGVAPYRFFRFALLDMTLGARIDSQRKILRIMDTSYDPVSSIDRNDIEVVTYDLAKTEVGRITLIQLMIQKAAGKEVVSLTVELGGRRWIVYPL